MHPADLERLVDSELRRLPMPQAPRTLLPRVLSAAQGWMLRPWYSRAWFTWPLAWQAVAVCVLAISAWGGLWLVSVVRPEISTGFLAASALTDAAALVGRVAATIEAAQDLCRTLGAPFARQTSAFVVLMLGACVVFGAALNHVIVERA